MNLRSFLHLMMAGWLALSLGPAQGQTMGASPAAMAISQPILKWANGGCYASWCETGWYSSPAVADLDGDGQAEVIASAYSIVSLDGSSGALEWRVRSGHDRSYTGTDSVGRTWPGIVVANIDGSPGLEIATAHSGGWVSVYDSQGVFKPGWPQQPAPGYEMRSLGVYDLDGDGRMEILAASTAPENQWWAFQADGSLRPSHWPQHGPDSATNGYTHGAYNQNLAAGDIDGDGRAEIVGPNDTHYIAAFEDDGSQVLASAIYGLLPGGARKPWSRVGVHVDHAVDLRGYAECGLEHRPNFANAAPIIVDLTGDGSQEVVVVGNVYNCDAVPYQDLYEIPMIFNGDRTRWKAGAFDWTVLPAPEPGSAPLSEDYNQIESNAPNPVAADLDGDGNKEILYPSYDGRVHAYWLDRTEHGSWPYTLTVSDGFIRFASEPVVADLDKDGQAEVIFSSWAEKGSGKHGKLHILTSQGVPVWEVDLPAPFGGGDWNGALAAPTLANIDADADLEVVLNTAHSGVVAYDLPGTAGARLLWATGRGSFQRSGSLIRGSLAGSTLVTSKAAPGIGDMVEITLSLRNPGPALDGASAEITLPVQLSYTGSLSASSGAAVYDSGGHVVRWTGAVPPAAPVTVRFSARVANGVPAGTALRVDAVLDDGERTTRLAASMIVGGRRTFLPVGAAR